MVITSWLSFVPFLKPKKQRKPGEAANDAVEVAAETLEERLVLTTINYTASTDLLKFTADAGDNDNVQVTQPTAASFKIVVGNSDVIALGGDAVANPDFVLSTTTTLNDTLTINTGAGNAPISQFTADLGGGTNQINLGALSLGGLTVSNGGTVTMSTTTVGPGGLSVAGNIVTLNGAVTANNGSDVSFRTNGGLAVDDLTINSGITLAGGNGNLTLVAADSILQNNGTISLQGSGQLNATAGLGTGAGTFTMSGTGAISSDSGAVQVVAAGNIVTGSVSNNAGGIFITSSDAAVTINGLITSTGDSLSIQADQGVTLNSNLNAGGGGGISVSADVDKNGSGAFVIPTTGTVTTANGQITLSGADIDFNSGTVNAGTADVLLQPSAANETVNLGTNTAFGLTLADLLKVTAGSLEIGAVSAGDINFTSAISGLHTNTLVFVTGGDVKQNAGATISVTQLGIVTNGLVALTEANDVGSLAINLVTSGKPVAFTDSHDLTIGTVGGIPGISTVVGDVTITLLGSGSRLTLNNDITTDLGANVSLTMDDLTLNANIDAGTNQFSIHPFTPGRGIDLGTDTPGTLGLTNVELNRIKANRLQVGSDTAPISGNITISAPITPIQANQLSLSTGGAILDTNGTNPDITVQTLLMQAGTGIASGGSLSTVVSGLEAVSVTGDINITNTGALTVGGFTNTLAGLRVTNTGNINLNNTGSITLNGADGQATIQAGATGGNVTIAANGVASDFTSTANNKSIRAASGNVSVTAGRDILLGTGGTNFDNDINASGSVGLFSGRNVTLDGDADVASDDFGHNTGADLTVTAAGAVSLVNTHGDAASLQANGTAGGDLNITAGTNALLTNNSTAAPGLRSQSGDINLHADRVAFGSTSAANAFGIFNLNPVSSNWAVNLGSASDATASTLELSNIELNRITADTLRIGSLANAGSVTISAPVSFNPAQVDTLSLATGGSISDGASGALTVSNLKATSNGAITLDNQTHQVGTLALNSAAGIVDFEGATGFTVSSVDGTDGVSSANQNITLRALNGNITVANTPAAQDINAGSAAVSIRAGGTGIFTHNASAGIFGLAGVDLFANQINLNGTVTATSGRVRLAPANAGISVNLGGADSGTQLGISDAELDRINAPTIQVGDTGVVTTPNVSVSAVITPQFATTLVVDGDSLSQAGGSLNVTNLVLRGLSGIGSAGSLQTQATNLAFSNQTSGDVAIDNTGALTVTNLDGLTSASNTGGKISVTTHSPLTISTNMTAAGDLTLTALDSASVGDNVTISAGAAVVSTGGNLSLQAGDTVNVLGPLTVQTSNKTIILNGGFGDVDGAGAVTLSQDLNTVNTSPQILGGSGVDTITINRNSGTGGGTLNLAGAGGSDNYFLNYNSGTFSRNTAISDSSGANDTLTINGTDSDELVTYDSSLATPTATLDSTSVTFLGIEGATIDAHNAANDTLDVQETIPGFNPNGDGSVNTVVPLTWRNFEHFIGQTAMPVLSNVSLPNSNEGSTATLSGTLSDSSLSFGTTFTLHVNWGDGSAAQDFPILYNQANQPFSFTHVYVDDNPTGTSSDPYTVTASILGGANITLSANSTATLITTVSNVPPTLNIVSYTNSITENGVSTFTGTYTDPGTQDTQHLVVNWGDGTAPETIPVSGNTFTITHRFLDDNPTSTVSDLNTVSLTLFDDDLGQSATLTRDVQVSNLPPQITSLNLTASVIEGGTATLSGTYTDVGTLDTHTLTVNWGDGSAAQVLAVSGGSFVVNHVYVDDNPTGTPSDTMVVTATLADDDSGVDFGSRTIIVNNASPVLSNLAVTPPNLNQSGTTTLSGNYTDAGIQDTHTLDINWGDGSAVQTVAVAGGSFSVPHQYLVSSPQGGFTINATLRDDDTGTTTVSISTVVNNVAPTFTSSLGLSSNSINENGSVTLTGTYTDPGTLDTHTLLINWGDGTTPQLVNVSGGAFSVPHQYLDDNPTGTASDVNTISVTLADNAGGTATASTSVTVNNVAPTLGTLSLTPVINEGAVATLTGTYGDVGTQDTHVLTINWGDGSAVNTISVSGGVFSTTHQYTDAAPTGTYTVSVQLRDDDMAAGTGPTGTATITVNNVAPTFVGLPNPSLLGTNGQTISTVGEGGTIVLTGNYTDPGTDSGHTLRVDWGDGTPPQTVNVVGGAYSLTHQYLDDNPTGTPSDVNTISLTLMDSHGGTATTSTQLTILNAPPVLTSLNITPSIPAGGTAILTGSYTDAGTQDTQVIDINWGDGTALQTVNVSGGTFSIPHVYASASSVNGDTVQVRLRDDDIPQNGPGGATGSTTVVVQNVAPVFVGTPTLSSNGNSVNSVNENGSVTLSGAYSDQGDSTNHTLMINWGDGTSTQTVTVSGGTFSVVHQYLDDNPTGTPSDLNTISLTLSDSQGGSVSTTAQITVNNVAPVLTNLSITSPIQATGTSTLTGTYFDVGTLDTQLLDIDWGDGTALQTVNVSGGTFSVPHVYASASSANGNIVQVRLRDDDIPQNGPGGATGTATVVVQNVAPTFVGNVTVSPTSVNENGSVTLSGAYSDQGDNGNHTLTINWGDGTSAQTVTVSGGTFSVVHQYLDDNPTGTTSDNNTISLTLADSQGATATTTTQVNVSNLTPVLTNLNITPVIAAGGTATLTGSYSDVGTQDTHFLDINWGDGTPLQTVTVSGGTFVAQHVYLSASPANGDQVVVRLRDDDIPQNGPGGANGSTLILVQNAAPTFIGSLGLSATSINENGSVTLTGAYSDPNDAGNHNLVINWGDGSPVQTVAVSGGTFSVAHQYLDDNPTGTQSDVNTITAMIQDSNGGSSTATTSLTVNNVNPVASIVGAPTTSALNVPITLTSLVTDVGTQDTFTYAWTATRNGVVYSTGNAASFTFTPNDGGSYTVGLVVTDDDHGSANATNSNSTVIQVNDPTVGGVTIAPVTVSGKPTDVTLTATDPNNPNGNPNFTFNIDWNGDGTIDQTVIAPSGTKIVHEFNDPGTYNVHVTATAVGSQTPGVTSTATVNVVRVLFQDGVLYLGGTSNNDIITISRVSRTEVKVIFDKRSQGKFSPTIRIEAYGCPGNDKIRVATSILVPVQLYGQDGNDVLKGGGGDDYIAGGDGNDRINGSRGSDISEGDAGNDIMHAGSGHDIVIGGTGQDTIYGKFARDILIGGTTSHDGNLVELNAIRNEWAGSGDFNTRISNLENGGGLNGNVKLRPGVDTFDDGVRDDLTSGFLKENWFLTFFGDHVHHKSKSDRVN
jgi:hypothetical protein